MSQSIALGATELSGRTETADGAESKPYGWILHPAIDMLLCCGGLVWAFFSVHFFLIAPAHNIALTQMMALFAIILTHCFSETHTVATLVRAYRTADTRRQYAAYTHWAALACAAVGLLALFVQGLTPLLAKLYLVWVAQHFTAQTYGMVLLYCFKTITRSNLSKRKSSGRCSIAQRHTRSSGSSLSMNGRPTDFSVWKFQSCGRHRPGCSPLQPFVWRFPCWHYWPW